MPSGFWAVFYLKGSALSWSDAFEVDRIKIGLKNF
jgi:hypothetical protein